MRAHAELTVDRGPGAPRIRWRAAPPVVLRQTGARRVHLVQAAGGPLGGDELGVTVRLVPGTGIQVHSAAATVVQPGVTGAPARWTVTAELGDAATLDWHPEPTVICDDAELHSSLAIALHGSARAVLRETVVLGRSGQRGGRFRGELVAERDGVPLLAHTLLLDGADPALTGPAGTASAHVVGTLAVLGEGFDGPPVGAGEQPGLRWACSALDGPGWLLLALGDRPTDVARLLDHTAEQVTAPDPNPVARV